MMADADIIAYLRRALAPDDDDDDTSTARLVDVLAEHLARALDRLAALEAEVVAQKARVDVFLAGVSATMPRAVPSVEDFDRIHRAAAATVDTTATSTTITRRNVGPLMTDASLAARWERIHF